MLGVFGVFWECLLPSARRERNRADLTSLPRASGREPRGDARGVRGRAGTGALRPGGVPNLRPSSVSSRRPKVSESLLKALLEHSSPS